MMIKLSSVDGLSPRTRGSLGDDPHPAVPQGSIPAHAGEPPQCQPGPSQRLVYPRARGGAVYTMATGNEKSGLSPRTRGSPVFRRLREIGDGSIPAHAGEPVTDVGGRTWPAVYPRARGGAAEFHRQYLIRNGLSPRTRGSRKGQPPEAAPDGSIPAHAGEPAHAHVQTDLEEVYPRARGGARVRPVISLSPVGLSPRTRGSPDSTGARLVLMGSIPAHAGEPHPRSVNYHVGAVYPRARGGASVSVKGPSVMMGLSPRTRGSLLEHVHHGSRDGSIPAHAGEPCLRVHGR